MDIQYQGSEKESKPLKGPVLSYEICSRVWSLANMERIRLSLIRGLFDKVNELRGIGKTIPIEPLGKEQVKSILQGWDTIIEQLSSIGFPVSTIAVDRIKVLFVVGKPLDASAFDAAVLHFYCTLEDEFESKLLYLIPSEKSAYAEQKKPLFGPAVANHFPSAVFDISECGMSYAVGRNTSCVFHCMRIMERGIYALAASMGIPEPIDQDRSWGKLLNKVSGQIDLRKKSKEKEWIARVGRLEDSCAFLRAAKDAWRDDTMHIGPKYDEEDAERIMVATKNFMKDLAKLMKEDGVFLLP